MAKNPALKRANQRLQLEIRRLHKRVDEHQVGDHDFGKVSCTRGCSACCKQLVVAEISEAEYIITRNPAAVSRATPKLLEQARIAAQLPGDLDSEEGTALASDAYWQLDNLSARREVRALLDMLGVADPLERDEAYALVERDLRELSEAELRGTSIIEALDLAKGKHWQREDSGAAGVVDG